MAAMMSWEHDKITIVKSHYSVKNNANRFLFQKANLPIFIHRGKLLFSPGWNTRSLNINEPPGCWYCIEVFLRVLRFSPPPKNQHFQIPIRSETHGHWKTSS